MHETKRFRNEKPLERRHRDVADCCCVGGSTGQRGGLGGVLYAVCTGVADRVRVRPCPAVYGAVSAQTSLLQVETAQTGDVLPVPRHRHRRRLGQLFGRPLFIELRFHVKIKLLLRGQVTIIFVVSVCLFVCLSVCLSVCLFVCLCRVFLSRLRSDLDQTRTHVTCPSLVVSPRI